MSSTLEEMIRKVVGEPAAVEYLLLVKDAQGRWQCSGRRRGSSNSFTVHVTDDPCEALMGCVSQAHRVATIARDDPAQPDNSGEELI